MRKYINIWTCMLGVLIAVIGLTVASRPWDPAGHGPAASEFRGRAVSNLVRNDAPVDEILRAVKESGYHPDELIWSGGSVMSSAVYRGRHDVVEQLLRLGANPDGRQLLFHAVFANDVEMADLLLQYGANPDIVLAAGMTLRRAAEGRADNGEIGDLLAKYPQGGIGRELPALISRPGLYQFSSCGYQVSVGSDMESVGIPLRLTLRDLEAYRIVARIHVGYLGSLWFVHWDEHKSLWIFGGNDRLLSRSLRRGGESFSTEFGSIFGPRIRPGVVVLRPGQGSAYEAEPVGKRTPELIREMPGVFFQALPDSLREEWEPIRQSKP